MQRVYWRDKLGGDHSSAMPSNGDPNQGTCSRIRGMIKFNFRPTFKVLMCILVDIPNMWLERCSWNSEERLILNT